MNAEDRYDITIEALDLLSQAADLVAQLDDPALYRYVLPHLQGQEHGWMGEQAIDRLRKYADAQEDAMFDGAVA